MDVLNQYEIPFLMFIREYLTCPFLDFVLPKITFLADSGWIWIVLAVICLIFPKTRKTGLVMGMALLMGLIVGNLTLKPLIARTRPYDFVEGVNILVERLSDFSFPSGHTLASFEGAVAIALTCKKRYGIPAICLAIIIAFSRLYLFVHYPTDVIVGCVLGISFAFLAKYIYESIEAAIKKRAEQKNA